MNLVELIADLFDISTKMAKLSILVVLAILAAAFVIFMISLSVYFFRGHRKSASSETEKQKEAEETKDSEKKGTGKKDNGKKSQPAGKQAASKKPEPKKNDPPGKKEGASEPASKKEDADKVTSEKEAEDPAEPAAETGTSDSELQGVVDHMLVNRKTPSQRNKSGRSLSPKERLDNQLSSRRLQKKASQMKIPKTAQESIPYQHVFPDTGIFEIEPGYYSKSYLLDDVNYQNAKDAEQAEMFMQYGVFLNSFDPSCRIQVTVNQKNINMDEFEEETLLPMQGDQFDELREEHNELLKNRILEGKNNLVKEKYITVSVKAVSYDAARTVFARLDSEIVSNIKKIGGAGAIPLSSAQRLEILHDIYNLGEEGMFGNNMERDENGNLVFAKDKFSFEIMHRMGLTTKDMIAPESFSFKSDHGMLGDKYFRALFLRKVPSFLTDNVLDELTKTDCNMLTSLIFEPIEGEKALQMARNQIRNINANVHQKQRKLSKEGVSHELISMELQEAADESKELFRDLNNKNQKLFFMTLAIVHFADTKEQLDSDTKAIEAIGRTLLLSVKKLSWQQENGLATALPLCNNKLEIKRSLTTESASVFMPFVNQELNDRNGGMDYGVNAVSHNLIRHNRRNSKNGNGFYLGSSGSGKSMMAKQEMKNVLLSSEDTVIVIDPEGEYYPMAELLGGEVVRIATGADVHINPFDINMNYDKDDDPISIKSDFIISLCETIAGDRYGLNPSQRSLIDRCVKKVYEPFLNSYDSNTGEYDHSLTPTLVDFYNELRKQSGYDAQQLADGLEIYVTGSLNVFAHPTNVKYNNRFVVYDIKDIGSNMKSMGLLVVLDNIWNQIMEGRKAGRFVWFYIDEIYLLFKTQTSAEFLRSMYKRARKYGGLPTGITQNVTELLESEVARIMLSNSDFIVMMNQAPLDRAALGELLNISPTQLGHITNSNPGEGLIYDGTHTVPFISKVPKNTKAYWAMTTNLSDLKNRDAG